MGNIILVEFSNVVFGLSAACTEVFEIFTCYFLYCIFTPDGIITRAEGMGTLIESRKGLRSRGGIRMYEMYVTRVQYVSDV